MDSFSHRPLRGNINYGPAVNGFIVDAAGDRTMLASYVAVFAHFGGRRQQAHVGSVSRSRTLAVFKAVDTRGNWAGTHQSHTAACEHLAKKFLKAERLASDAVEVDAIETRWFRNGVAQ